MSAFPYNLALNCSLTQYLIETSTSQGGVKASFAGAMLVDLGGFDPKQTEPNISNMKELFQMLIDGNENETLSEVSEYCKHCAMSAKCLVGEIVLNN